MQNTETFVSTLPQSIFNDSLMVDGIANISRDQTTRTSLIDNEFAPENYNGLAFFRIDQVRGSTRRRYQEYINDIEEMCPLWIAKCRLVSQVHPHPHNYF